MFSGSDTKIGTAKLKVSHSPEHCGMALGAKANYTCAKGQGRLDMASQARAPLGADRAANRRKAATPFGAALPIALIGIIATAIGFLPTFFMKLGNVDFIHHLHGWTMTGWIVLVLTQILLIRFRRHELHRLLGWSSLVLFVLMIVTSFQMVALMMSGKSGLPFGAAKFFGWSDFANAPLLLFAFGAAIYCRKDRHLHSRLMAVTVLVSIVPALARMFNIMIWRSFEPGLYLSMHPTYLLILGVLVLAAMADWRRGRLRWPLPMAFGWIALVYATQWPMMGWQWFDTLARWLGSFA
jgi:hypothetical protein